MSRIFKKQTEEEKTSKKKDVENSVTDDDNEWIPFEPIFHELVRNQKVKGIDCNDRHYAVISSFEELKNLP
jgi:hypothetical protein